AVGLLGVAALFPVGSHYLRQGDVSDRADAIAASALNASIARGMLDPENWIIARGIPANNPSRAVYDTNFATAFESDLAAATNDLTSGTNPIADPLLRQIAINRRMNLLYGSIYFLDPLGVAETMSPDVSVLSFNLAGAVSANARFFPATVTLGAFAPGHPAWQPWAAVGGESTGFWPVRRLSVSTGALPINNRPLPPMPPQAEALVVADDDLSIELNDYRGNPYEFTPDNPSQQLWQASNNQPLKRLSRSDFSWALTIVPTTPAARNGLITDPESYSYDVSAVVYHKRAAGGRYDRSQLSPPTFGHDETLVGERMVRAAVGTTGVGGGQLRVSLDGGELPVSPTPNAPLVESPLEKLAEGQWVMLFGPHPQSTSLQPLLFCQWYRVISIEEDPQVSASIFVRGPDWPWTPGGDASDPATGIQNDLRMVIVPDVVTVHTRTMKLNPGSAWDVD
ncbi:MAG: hypothetical protein AAGF31_11825, partial [Planctomycetota bacterium]